VRNGPNCGETRKCQKPSFSFANIKDARVLDTHNVEHKLQEDLAFGHVEVKDLTFVMLLDNQSTDNIFNSPDLLKNVHQGPFGIKILTNSGGLTANLKGCLESFDCIWFYKNAMTNVLSVCDVKQHGHCINCSAKKDGMFCVTTPAGKLIKFKPSPSRSHCHDTRESAITMLNTVEENESGYSA